MSEGSRENPRKEISGEIEDKRERTPNDNRPPKAANFFSLFSTVKNETNSYNQSGESSNWLKELRDWVTLIFVIATTVGIFIQASILRTTDHTFSAMRTNQVDTNERQQRAYVYARPGNVYNVSDGHRAEPRIVIGNSGATLSRETKRWAKAVILPKQSAFEIKRFDQGEREEGVMEVVPRVDHAIIRYSGQITAEQSQQLALKDGPLRLYVYGEVGYFDVFQKERRTQFCFMYFGEMDDFPKNGGPGFNSTQARYCEARNTAN